MSSELETPAAVVDNSVSDLLVDLWNTGLYDAVDACMQEEAKQAKQSARAELVSRQMEVVASEEGALTVSAEGAMPVNAAVSLENTAGNGRNRMLWSVAFKIRSAVFTILLIAVVSLVLAMLLNPDMSITQLYQTMLERVS